jgi:transposase
MKRKHTYQAVGVERIRLAELVPLLVAGCIVAIDVAKEKMMVALATAAGEVVKLFRFKHPTETGLFLQVVTGLGAALGAERVVAAMEPTGTYGDAIRYQLFKAGVPVFMVSPKRTHDSKELFDGVPSLHDGKSAWVIAKLQAMGLSKRWEPPPPTRTSLRALVELRQHEQQHQEQCYGRLEAMLARHWPELGHCADVREQKSALHLLVKYASPARVKAEPDAARALLRETSRSRLSAEAMEATIESARSTVGVPMMLEEELLVRTLASQVLELGGRMDEFERAMQSMNQEDEAYARLQPWMGTVTAAVLVTLCDPRQYVKARQMEKACGLNLRVKSSGECDGRLSITKRGPGHVRQMLYLFALRMIRDSCVVRAWYMKRKGYTEDNKQRAVVAVMRKLVRAAFHVARGNVFDASKLFDVRRLDLNAASKTEKASAADKTDSRRSSKPPSAVLKQSDTEQPNQPTAEAPERGAADKTDSRRSLKQPSPVLKPSDAETPKQPTAEALMASMHASAAPEQTSAAAPQNGEMSRPTSARAAVPKPSSSVPKPMSLSAVQQASLAAAAACGTTSSMRPRTAVAASKPSPLSAVRQTSLAAATACDNAKESSTKARTVHRPLARGSKRAQQVTT